MTTCPSGVHYGHLVDHARAYIEDRYRRPLRERLLRGVLAWVLPHPGRFRLALALARLAKPAEPLIRRYPALKPVAAMLALAPSRVLPRSRGRGVSGDGQRFGHRNERPRSGLGKWWRGRASSTPSDAVFDHKASKGAAAARPLHPSGPHLPQAGEDAGHINGRLTPRRGRVVLLQGCAEPVLRPEIREAAVRLLTRAGYQVVFARGEACCGSLVHHMGRKDDGLDAARRNIDAWTAEIEGEGVDVILATVSGCGSTLKDYGFMLRSDPAYAGRAARVSGLARDISEFLAQVAPPATGAARPLRVAYHAACSLQHGQKVTDAPRRLLAEAGFEVLTPREAHLCCGSAGVYNILQSEIAGQIGARKVAELERLQADVIATGNIGCATQIGVRARTPVVHTVELLDWASGGPVPESLSR